MFLLNVLPGCLSILTGLTVDRLSVIYERNSLYCLCSNKSMNAAHGDMPKSMVQSPNVNYFIG